MAPGAIVLTVLACFVTIGSIIVFAVDGAHRTLQMPLKSGSSSLDVILHLALVTAVSFGLSWILVDRACGWNYAAGGSGRLPTGWKAVILSLCMTLSLVCVPALYQIVTGAIVLPPSHWKASILVIIGGACTYVLLFGTSSSSEAPNGNGLRHMLIPDESKTPGLRGLAQEALYTTFIVGFIVLPYRVVVNATEPLSQLILGRIVLPWIVYFSAMSIFIGVTYPDSLRDSGWLNLRGVVAGLLVMFCL
jgi:hypothetical protein